GGVLVRDRLIEALDRLLDVVRRRRAGLDPRYLHEAVLESFRILRTRTAAEKVEERHAIVGDGGIEKHDMAEAFRDAVHDARDDHASIAMASEHDVVEVLEQDQVYDVVDMRFQIDVRAVEVLALA